MIKYEIITRWEMMCINCGPLVHEDTINEIDKEYYTWNCKKCSNQLCNECDEQFKQPNSEIWCKNCANDLPKQHESIYYEIVELNCISCDHCGNTTGDSEWIVSDEFEEIEGWWCENCDEHFCENCDKIFLGPNEEYFCEDCKKITKRLKKEKN